MLLRAHVANCAPACATSAAALETDGKRARDSRLKLMLSMASGLACHDQRASIMFPVRRSAGV